MFKFCGKVNESKIRLKTKFEHVAVDYLSDCLFISWKTLKTLDFLSKRNLIHIAVKCIVEIVMLPHHPHIKVSSIVILK